MSALEQFPHEDQLHIEREHELAIRRELEENPVRIPPEVKAIYDSDDRSMYLAVGGILGAVATTIVVKKLRRKH